MSNSFGTSVRILLGILLVMMLLFGGVQYNDPDGLLWMVIYSVPAFWCAMALIRKSVFTHGGILAALGFSLALCVAGIVYFWPLTPQFWTKAVWYNVETAREGMGLMIVFIVLLIVTLYTGSLSSLSNRSRLSGRRFATGDNPS